MKANLILVAATALFLSPTATAQDKHDHQAGDDHKHGSTEHADEHADHDHDKMAGPNGGKVLHKVNPHAEFFVTKDRKILITFIDGEGKATTAPDCTISVICGKRSAPTRIKFNLEGKVFTSDKALPDGNDFPTIVQFKMKDSGKTVRERFNLNLKDCPTCDHQEYACTCEHAH